MPVFGLNNGITPIIAYNYGARQRKRMVKTIKVSLVMAFCLTFIGFVLFESIPQALLGLFNASNDMLKIGVPALRTIGVHYLIAWFCIIVGTVFQALGKAVFSMVVSIMLSACSSCAGCVSSCKIWRTSYGMVVISNCRGYVIYCFTYISYKNLE